MAFFIGAMERQWGEPNHPTGGSDRATQRDPAGGAVNIQPRPASTQRVRGGYTYVGSGGQTDPTPCLLHPGSSTGIATDVASNKSPAGPAGLQLPTGRTAVSLQRRSVVQGLPNSHLPPTRQVPDRATRQLTNMAEFLGSDTCWPSWRYDPAPPEAPGRWFYERPDPASRTCPHRPALYRRPDQRRRVFST